MDDELERQILERLEGIESRLTQLERDQNLLKKANARAWAASRSRRWLRPPMWTAEQYLPRALDLAAFPPAPALPVEVPRIAIVTPSYNHAHFLDATIDSILAQNYPNLHYHVQDGGSTDGTVELLKARGDRISWRSAPDNGQSHAINLGFDGVDSDLMAYLNSDDIMLPGTLAYVANFFRDHPNVDIVYGHRVFVDRDGRDIGRAVFPTHHGKTLKYADYIAQETMFWRRRVWDALKAIDESFHYAMDWDFILRAQDAGFRFARLPRFLACFRIHDEQKTAATYDVGAREMQRLRLRCLGFAPSHLQIRRAVAPYVARQLAYHWGYRLGLLKY
jgi:glycosyltransferase involved in cell wall biosynthesis